MTAVHVALIEDDPRVREVVERGLGARGLQVSAAPDGAGGLDLVRRLDVDLVLLDLILPDAEGRQVLEEIRAIKPRLPVIVLTALGDTTSKVGGLEAGADDYVTKPFSIDELAARIRARLRFQERGDGILEAGPLRVDLGTHRVTLNQREIPMSPRELALLVTFLRHQGRVLSQEQLLQMVWDINFDPGSNIVEVYVAALRKKMGAKFIQTVRGLGYRFVIPDESAGGEP
jgi:DNA-binding response OmpR family regulator